MLRDDAVRERSATVTEADSAGRDEAATAASARRVGEADGSSTPAVPAAANRATAKHVIERRSRRALIGARAAESP
jgi:hypothetical protein